MRSVLALVALAACASLGSSAAAEEPDTSVGTAAPTAIFARDENGHTTLRATRLSEPLELDGVLDERVYEDTPAIEDFTQQEPEEGAPSTERTEAWIFFDDDAVYVSGRMWDSHPERMVASEMRRDNPGLWENENFGFVLDTFLDRRNAFMFYISALGGLYDGQVTDERNINADWNTVWEARTGRFDEGWTAEIRIPFKSLRYAESTNWGINLRRRVRWKNEVAYVAPIPRSLGIFGLGQVSEAADLIGIEPPSRKLNLEIKPYATGQLSTDREADPFVENDLDGNFGGELKLGLTRTMTMDFTVNTDFAQVESDVQQVNLTRFSVLFPEKREFFLDGQGLFNFGGISSGRRNAFAASGGGGTSRLTPIMFFSRRVGLSADADVVPIRVGGRLTGSAGDWGIGALQMRTGDGPGEFDAPTDFSVLRVKRNVLRRSYIGVMAARRNPLPEATGTNWTYGIDAAYNPRVELRINAYYAKTDTTGLEGDDESYKGTLNYRGDRYGFWAERLKVGKNFNPEIGFIAREDFARNFVQARFFPRPASIDAVRRFRLFGNIEHIVGGDGELESQVANLRLATDFNSSDIFQVSYRHTLERLDEPFEITDDVTIPPGDYRFGRWNLFARLANQRPVSGQVRASFGPFYDGTRTQARYDGRIELSSRFSMEPRIDLNWVKLPGGDFQTNLIGGRLNFTLTPRAAASALLQYNSSDGSIAANVRLRWEYSPGSDVFLVYNEGRNTLDDGPTSGLLNRSIVFKLTRLVRF